MKLTTLTILNARTLRLAHVALAMALALSLFLLAGYPPTANGEANQPSPRVRIGTYDSRAIAVAYVRSQEFQNVLKQLQSQRAEAQAKGDHARVKELEAQGQAMQKRAHLQGFSDAPVDDVLQTVRDHLPQVAMRNNVIAITRAADYCDHSVELVDVTDELVMQFQPDEKTLKTIRELRKQKPVPIEIVAEMDSKK